MIDNISFKAPMTREMVDSLLKNRILTRHQINNPSSNDYELYKYCHLKVIFHSKDNFITVKNSLNTYWNGNNFLNNLSYSELTKCLGRITTDLRLNYEDAKIRSIEIGLALQIPFNTRSIVYAFESYRLKPFVGIKPPRGSTGVLMKVCPGSKFDIKVYDAGCYHKLPGNVLKFEIRMDGAKLKKTLHLESHPTLKLLLDKSVYSALGSRLVTLFNQIHKAPIIIPPSLSTIEQKELFSFLNPGYWAALKSANRMHEMKLEREKFLKVFRNLDLPEYALISSLMEKEIEKLLEPEKCDLGI